MEIFKYLELFTNYQINITLLALLIIALLISGLFLYYTNDFKPTAITFLSILLIPILTGLTLVILYEFFDIQPSEKHTLIMWAALFINTINLSTLVAKYSTEILKKDFDIDHVTRHHFKTTLNLFITVILITGAISAFVELNMLIILIPTALISTISIALNHIIARFLLKEK